MRAPSPTISNAKRLRREMSLPEILLWECLRAGRLDGHRFRRQHPIGRYVLDFYCSVSKFAVEVDGAHHELAGQMSHDAKRDAWLATQGIRVARVAASDVLDGQAFDGVLRMIRAVADGAEIMPVYASPVIAPPPSLRATSPVHGGGSTVEAVCDRNSSPAERGRGTTRSVVEGASVTHSAIENQESGS